MYTRHLSPSVYHEIFNTFDASLHKSYAQKVAEKERWYNFKR